VRRRSIYRLLPSFYSSKEVLVSAGVLSLSSAPSIGLRAPLFSLFFSIEILERLDPRTFRRILPGRETTVKVSSIFFLFAFIGLVFLLYEAFSGPPFSPKGRSF